MMDILYQDTDIIIVDPYTFSGNKDIYIKTLHPYWSQSVVGNDYKLLIKRKNHRLITATNEFYQAAYSAIEPSLTGDVLIIGAGLQIIDPMLVTGTSWKWVEINPYLASINPSNGTIHEGDGTDIDFLATLGMFDTIFVDIYLPNRIDFASIMNVGANIIYMTI
jgi:hypothetical protein